MTDPVTGGPPQPGRHLPLLLALLALFLLYPLMLESGRVRFMRFAFLLVLAFGVHGLMNQRRFLIWALILAIPAMVGQVAAYADPSQGTMLLATGLGFVFLAFVMVVVLLSVLSPGRVTFDKIAGSIATYLLMGLVWGLAYGMLAILDPTALRGLEQFGAGHTLHGEYGVIYFSFVTLTTLGYGDIVPISPFAQSLAWMEAAAGQLFLAVLVARLVGLHIAHSTLDER